MGRVMAHYRMIFFNNLGAAGIADEMREGHHRRMPGK